MRSIDRPALERLPLRLLALVTVLVLVGGVQALAATIHTDLWLYQKGDTVQVFGEDFGPSETVDVVTTSPTGAPVDAGTAQTDAVGAFGYAFVLDSDESGIFDVTATGRDSGFTATTQFDPAHASLSPGSKAFGSVDVGSSSSAQTFTISNTGTTVLNVQGVVLSGGNADQFTLNTTGMSTSVAAGTSTTFSVTFTPTSAGAKSASVNVTTNAEDPSAPLTGTGVATDTTPPTVSMSSAASDPTATSPIPVTVAFSESVTGFVAGDVTASNGSVSNFAGSGASYTFDLVPAAAGTVTANIAAGVASDGAGNPNTAATQFSRTYAPNTAPTISDVANQTIVEDGTTGALAVTVDDAQTAAGSLTLTGSSSDTTLVPNANITFGGSGASRTVTVVPAANRTGSATITLTVSDGSLTASDTFTVTVTAVNDAPVCQDVAISTGEDTPGSTAPDCTDVDGDSLSYTVGGASDGTSGFSAGTITYDPNANFSGSDAFTYTADDRNGGSDTANVDVTVSAANDDPVCQDVVITTAEDGSGSIAPDCSDADGDALTYTVSAAADGTSGFSAGNLTYDTNANFNGSDGFTYTADDGNGGSDTANVDVTVTAVNDDPVCRDVSITTAEDAPGSVAPDCSDVDGDSLSYTVSGASEGTSGFSAGTITYDPNANFSGSDGFTYTADDGNGGTDTAHVDVSVTAVNDAPVCNDVSITTAEDTAGSTAPDCSDVEGDPLTYSVGPASDGTSGFVLVLITYDPDPNFNGSDGFTYTADDGNGGTDTANVDVAVSAENDAPSATDDAATTAQDTAVTGIDVLGNDTDVDGNTLSVTAFDATSAESGTVSCAGDCSYTPPSGFSGSDSFGYTVGDGNGGSDTAIVTITVSAVAGNEPPTVTILPAAQVVQYSDPIRRVTVFGDDAETPGSGLVFRASGMPEGVTFTDGGGGRAVLEGVADDAPGIYRVTVTVTDADGGRASATTVITIAPEDAIVRYTGDHLVFTEPGSHGGEVNLSATISDLSAAGAAFRVPVLRAATSSDATAGDVSGASVTFMSGETVLCGPVPVAIGDPTDPTFGTAACDEPVALPLGSHDVDVHVSGAYRFSATVGQVEVDRATRNYVAGGGFMTATSSAGDVPATDGSRVSFGFRVRFSPRLTNVRGHANVLFVSDGATYQVRAHDIDSIELGPRAETASFVTHASLSDVTDPLDPVMLGSSLRLVVWMTDGGSRDRIAVAAYRGGTLIFASGWNGAPVKAALGGGAIVLR